MSKWLTPVTNHQSNVWKTGKLIQLGRKKNREALGLAPEDLMVPVKMEVDIAKI